MNRSFLYSSDGSWLELGSRPHYVGELKMAPYSFPAAWFSAQADPQGCLIHWLSWKIASPLPAQASQAVLALGQQMLWADRCYTAYLEPWPWVEEEGGDTGQPLSQQFWSFFLGLPVAMNWWKEAYSQASGFVQMRNGVVPCVDSVQSQAHQGFISLSFEVRLFDLIQGDWVQQGQPWQMQRKVGGRMLQHALDCAPLVGRLTRAPEERTPR